MGPRLGSRGSAPESTHHRLHLRLASMGPRLGSRGSAEGQPDPDLGRCASMGPRLGSRGSTVTGASLFPAGGLQWGRGLAAADLTEFAIVAAVGKRLQWGRGLAAADLGGLRLRVDAVLAASMGPRLGSRGSLRSPLAIGWPVPLQWGRGLAAADLRSRRASFSRRGWASMGPRLGSRGSSGHPNCPVVKDLERIARAVISLATTQPPVGPIGLAEVADPPRLRAARAHPDIPSSPHRSRPSPHPSLRPLGYRVSNP